MRPIGDWSMLMILSIWLSPSTPSWAPGRSFAWCRRLATAWWRVSLTRVDFPEPGDPGHAAEDAERDRDVDPLQVVFAGVAHDQRAARLAALRRDLDAALAREVLAGQRGGVLGDLGGGALGDHVAAVFAGAGAEVDQVVGGEHRPLVVLDHDHGVAEVAQPVQRPDQLLVVALVKPDRGLVEHVHHSDQARADLRREPNPLRLTTRERAGRAREREVADADVVEEGEPFGDLAHDQPRDRPLGLAHLQSRRSTRPPPAPRARCIRRC